ncbi:MAG TPA: cyclic nucleotide-binding domain-containing protein [Aestuariivirgaceae bacterium]|jgi:CRP-like cAMP-binding protein
MKAMPLVPDFPSIQKTLATLPVSVYQQGEIVLAAGSTTGRLLVLRSGAVEVIRDGAQIARISEPGAVFGELAALLNKPHTADVRALERSEFSIADAAKLLGSDAAVTLYVAAILARRLDSANTALVEVKSQIEGGSSRSMIARTIKKIEELLASEGDTIAYAGYPYDPLAFPKR